jgi:AcrR family transcriptional regulator
MTDDLRARLVAAGVRLVAERGTASLSLREIARYAGVSHGAPRRYFPAHRDLLAAVARAGYDQLTAEVAAVPAHGDPPRDILHLGRLYLRFARENRGMFELMFQHELLTGSPERLRETSAPLFRLLTERLGPTTADPVLAAGALWANLHGIAQLSLGGSLQLTTATDDVDALLRTAVAAHVPAPRPATGRPGRSPRT